MYNYLENSKKEVSYIGLAKRKRNRLKDYDYSQDGAYFITICTEDHKCILSQIVGDGVLNVPKVELTECGAIIQGQICLMEDRYELVKIEKYVIMPNHLHFIIRICNSLEVCIVGTSRTPSPTNALIPQFVSTLKRFCNVKYGKNIWQRSYHDHIIRGENDYQMIWDYIENNPAKWRKDCFYKEET
ncbi:MAG: transposase [Clostridia bacterium]|nr:transposase [Clostridia bacterium]